MVNNMKHTGFRQIMTNKIIYNDIGDFFMKVKVIDEDHEKDLEESINEFLKTGVELIDIKFNVAVGLFSDDQIYCFSALIIYK